MCGKAGSSKVVAYQAQVLRFELSVRRARRSALEQFFSSSCFQINILKARLDHEQSLLQRLQCLLTIFTLLSIFFSETLYVLSSAHTLLLISTHSLAGCASMWLPTTSHPSDHLSIMAEQKHVVV